VSSYKAIYDKQGLVAEYEDGTLIWARQEIDQLMQHVNLMVDIKPYKSMIDGSIITSRSQHREHLRRHNCIEIGNEKMHNTPPPKQDNRRESLHRRLGDMSDRQANQILKELRRN